MLNETTVDAKIASVDAALRGKAEDAPVAFGFDLFGALVKRGLVNDALTAPVGGAGDAAEISKYRETHPARLDTGLPNDGFSVG